MKIALLGKRGRVEMKPCNFPERVNRRRKGAYDRLGDLSSPAAAEEAGALLSRIVPDARERRSKKFRGARRQP